MPPARGLNTSSEAGAGYELRYEHESRAPYACFGALSPQPFECRQACFLHHRLLPLACEPTIQFPHKSESLSGKIRTKSHLLLGYDPFQISTVFFNLFNF
ncbi:MAG: hypothetical protein ACT6FC_06915, partial [Methanosarcinaceae archaeon]